MTINIKQKLINLEIDFEVVGNNDGINNFASITEASQNDASFCYHDTEKAVYYVTNSNTGCILCKKDIIDKVHPNNGQQFFL